MRSPSVLGGARAGIRFGSRDLGAGDARTEADAPVRDKAPSQAPSQGQSGARPDGDLVASPGLRGAAVDASAPTFDQTAAAVDGAVPSLDASSCGHAGLGVPDTDSVLGIAGDAHQGFGGGPLRGTPATMSSLRAADDSPPTAVEIDAEDPVRQYRLEPSRGGTASVVADCAGLLVAVLVVATVRAVARGPLQRAGALTFAVTAAELALFVPVVAATISGTRRRMLQPPLLSAQLHALALPLAAGAAAVLAVWRVASAAVGLAHPHLDWVLAMCAVTYVTVPCARVVRTQLQKRPAKHTRVLIVGGGAGDDRLTAQLGAMPGVTVVGCVDDDPVEPARCLGRLTDLRDVCRQKSIGHVVVALTGSQPQTVVDAFRIDALRPVQGALPITVVTPWAEELPTDAKVHGLSSGLAGINFAPAAAGPWSQAVKVTMDRFIASVGIVCLAPLLIVVALGVRLTSPGPVLFRQERVGRNGRTFSILKFRTMRTADVHVHAGGLDGETTAGPFPKLKDDPRVTRLGRILRRTSIDELPQLWNVLRGEMSLVGPRPFMLDDAAAITGWPLRRYSVRPGLTGLWQVSGRNELSFAEMCRLDQLYVNSWTLGLDIMILLRTVRVIVSRQGAY